MAEKKFNGRTVKVGDMLATDTIILQARLLKLIGPAVDKLPLIFASRKKDATEDMKAAGDAAAMSALIDVFGKAEPIDVATFLKDICESAAISHDNGKNFDQIDFDGDFSGPNRRDIIPVVGFVLKEALGDFFSGALASGRRGESNRD